MRSGLECWTADMARAARAGRGQSASRTHQKPRFPVELSGVLALRAATRYRKQYDLWHRYEPPRITRRSSLGIMEQVRLRGRDDRCPRHRAGTRENWPAAHPTGCACRPAAEGLIAELTKGLSTRVCERQRRGPHHDSRCQGTAGSRPHSGKRRTPTPRRPRCSRSTRRLP